MTDFVFGALQAGDALGIMGLGGLGHMGLKLGVAMGLKVTVISTSERKREQAMAMGATRFVVSSDKEQMAAADRSLKFIIDTVSAEHQVRLFLTARFSHHVDRFGLDTRGHTRAQDCRLLLFAHKTGRCIVLLWRFWVFKTAGLPPSRPASSCRYSRRRGRSASSGSRARRWSSRPGRW